ncbi:hypothetical protein VTK26DRAFT_6584 [Humicola hyalothermophila]
MTSLQNLPQSWRRTLFLLPVLVISLILVTGLYNGSLPKPSLPRVVFPGQASVIQSNPTLDSVPDLIRALWAPLVLPMTAPTFTSQWKNTQLHLPPPEELIHTQPLGKRVCILDVDTRDLDGEGSIFADSPPQWDNLKNPSAGFLSHYLYAMIHGYSYKFVRAPKYADRAPHWTKVIMTKELLKQFDIVVMLDYDAMFPNPEVPLEWMLNYWKIGPEVLVAMSEDPPGDVNMDSRGKLNINSGFIIAQASEKTQRLLKDWAECPDETRYKGCGVWKNKAFHEQSAFSSFVRYDFLDGFSIDTHPQYIRTLPCAEANGIPEVAGCGCVGHLVRHYWGKKELTGREFSHNVMAAFTPLLAQAAFRTPGHVEDFRDRTLKGSEMSGSPAPPPPPPPPAESEKPAETA